MTSLEKYLLSFEHRGTPPTPERIERLLEIISVQMKALEFYFNLGFFDHNDKARTAIDRCNEIAGGKK